MHSTEEQLFEQALEFPPGLERADFLRSACHGDLKLELRVGQLIAAHESTSSLLDAPAIDPLLQLLSAPATDACGETIGPYKLLELIGEGGMGLVYMAEQEQPVRRRVALKIIKPGMDTRQVIARFEAERRALERLDHPGIARILDAGITPAGRPYFVMELVRGIAVTDFCDQAQLDTRARLELFIRVCQAVQHAHDAGIIHRDLKPANILVTLHDGVPVPKIIDFGIAKATAGRLVDQTLFTSFLQMIGTPVYMSPEQAQLTSQDVDERSDVYSLGVLLYELLTGTTPFASERLRSAGCPEVQRIINEEDPPLPSDRVATFSGDQLSTIANRRSVDPRRYRQSLRGDLDWIVMRGLEKDRNRRYLTAGELADDVRRYLQHEAVGARRPTAMYRISKLVRRRRTVVMLGTALLAVVGVSIGASTLLKQAERRHVRTAEHEALRAYVGDIQRAGNAFELGRMDEVRKLLASHQRPAGESELRGFEWHCLWGLAHAPARTLTDHRRDVFDVSWSPSGTYMATASADRSVIIRDGGTAQPVTRLDRFDDDVNSVTFSPDEATVAVAEEGRVASLWDWRTKQEVARLVGFKFPVARVFFTADADVVIATDVHWGGNDANTSTWRLSTGEQLAQLKHERALAVDADGTTLLVSSPGGFLTLRSLPDLVDLGFHADEDHAIVSGAFGPDRSSFVTLTLAGQATLWSIAGPQRTEFQAQTLSRGRGVALSPDGTLLAACGDDGVVRLWDAPTHQLRCMLYTRPGRCWSCAFSPDGARLAVARDGGAIDLYHIAELPFAGREIATAKADRCLWAIDSRAGTAAVAPIRQNKITVLDTLNGDVRRVLDTAAGARSSALTYARDGASLWIGDSAGVAREIDLNTRAELRRVYVGFEPAGVCAAPDGRVIATFPLFTTPPTPADRPDSRNVTFWDAETGTELLAVRDPGNEFAVSRVVGFVDSECCLVHRSPPDRLEYWDIQQRRRLDTAFEANAGITCASLALDRLLIAIGTSEPAIHLWDIAAARVVHTCYGHESGPEQLSFSPDGRTLASSAKGDIRLWHVATGQQLLRLPLQSEASTLLAFSADGKRLFVAAPVGSDQVERLTVWGQTAN